MSLISAWIADANAAACRHVSTWIADASRHISSRVADRGLARFCLNACFCRRHLEQGGCVIGRLQCLIQEDDAYDDCSCEYAEPEDHHRMRRKICAVVRCHICFC